MDKPRNGNINKWYTISEYVDTETGELIEKKQIENKEYKIRNKTIKYEINNEQHYGTRKITNECTRNEQTRMEL